MRALSFVLFLAACGAPPTESTLATRSARASASAPPRASLALGEVRWIEAGAPVRDVAASPGRIAAVMENGSVVSFELASGARAVVRPADAAAMPDHLSLSPDGALLALCVGTETSVVDVAEGRYGLVHDEGPCAGAPLWSPDGARLYVLGRELTLVARELATDRTLGTARAGEDQTFVAYDGTVVTLGHQDVDRFDPALAPLGRVSMPDLDAQHDSVASLTRVLARLDEHTLVYASGQGGYDVARIRESEMQEMLWRSAPAETWLAVVPLPDERAFLLVERESTPLGRVIEARTGHSIVEIAEVSQHFSVATDGSLVASALGSRIAVAGLR